VSWLLQAGAAMMEQGVLGGAKQLTSLQEVIKGALERIHAEFGTLLNTAASTHDAERRAGGGGRSNTLAKAGDLCSSRNVVLWASSVIIHWVHWLLLCAAMCVAGSAWRLPTCIPHDSSC
jgi:hypothetical protein